MKETLDPIPAERSADQTADQEGFANRKLIRPSLSRNSEGHNNHNHGSNHGPNHTSNHTPNHAPSERREPRERSERSASPAKKVAPSEQTNAENFYYQKQMQTKTPMVVVLRDGEEVHGYIEWYDKSCIKLNRSGAPNLMIYKPAIKYMFKEGEIRR
jgi:host factor-I protein